MANGRDERRLAAILAADIVGYSKLMEADESGTIAQLKTHRKELIDPKVEEYSGRIVKTMGDGILIEFPSVIDAVQMAVDVQLAIEQRNASVPVDKRIVFRVGINQGDIIVDGDDILGDGVNIAARLEAMAEPGGICISRKVRDEIRDKLPYELDDLGDVEVKNITRPVRAFRVKLGDAGVLPAAAPATKPATGKASPAKNRRKWLAPAIAAAVVLIAVIGGGAAWWQPWVTQLEAAKVENIAFSLPDRPSIAVLPFENMSGDPEQEYFSDGITEDIITDLSKISSLFVVARTSTFSYKGKPVKVQQVAEELGVRYVLEGSVRKADGRLRITAQLVDATTGGHLWAERYDRDLKDIFALQDEITRNIVTALKVNLTGEERTSLRYTDNVEAYDLFLQGREYQLLRKKEANLQAKQLFERAIELDPKFAAAYAELSSTLWELRKVSGLEQAFSVAQKAVDLDPSLPLAHTRLGYTYVRNRLYDQGIAEAKRAVVLDPNFAEGYARLGEILNLSGKPEEAIGLIKQAMRLNPRYPGEYLYNLGQSYYLMGRDEEAIATLRRASARNPKSKGPRRHLAVLYAEAGRMEEARAQVAELLKISSKESIERQIRDCAYTPAALERFLDGLRKAGYPEKSGST